MHSSLYKSKALSVPLLLTLSCVCRLKIDLSVCSQFCDILKRMCIVFLLLLLPSLGTMTSPIVDQRSLGTDSSVIGDLLKFSVTKWQNMSYSERAIKRVKQRLFWNFPLKSPTSTWGLWLKINTEACKKSAESNESFLQKCFTSYNYLRIFP